MIDPIVNETEEWRPVFGWEGLYSVSNQGRVLSVRRKLIISLCVRNGYMTMTLHRNGENMGSYVHRLVANAFIRTMRKGEQVNHRNGVRTDNRLANLEICNSSENHIHAYRVLKKVHPGAKLTLLDVKEIRLLQASGMKTKELSARFKISIPSIKDIKHRRTWFNY